MSQPPLPSDSSGTASKEGRFCFRPLSERRCRPGNLVGSCSGGAFSPPRGGGTPPRPSATKNFFPPPNFPLFLPGFGRSLLFLGVPAFFFATLFFPSSPPPPQPP